MPLPRTTRGLTLFCATTLLAALPEVASAGDRVEAENDPMQQMRQRWITPHAPFRIAGNTWYVGTEGISVLLVRGDAGAVLIDAGLPETAGMVLANLASLDVELAEIKLILTSHAHADHVGALAELKRATGARVLASTASARLLQAGGRNDPHLGDSMPYPAVATDAIVADREVVELGDLRLVAHSTPAHTEGSTTWSWPEQLDGSTVTMVYADSLTAPGYTLVGDEALPGIVADFRRGFARLRELRCDVLVTPHPEASHLFERMRASTLVDSGACRDYATRAEQALERSIARQQSDDP